MRIIVHIGLPKAATTSLQTAYFPAVAAENPNVAYAGPMRPGCRRPTPLREAFEVALRDGHEAPFLEALERTSAETVIFSLALGPVDDPICEARWKDRLTRLARILALTDHAIVVTLRDPLDAAFSHFAALSHRLPRRRRSLLAQAGTPAFQVFRYGHVFSSLFSLVDPERVSAAGFGDIVSGRLGGLDDVLRLPPRDRMLPHLARSCRTAAGILCERLSLEQSVARFLPSHIAQRYLSGLPAQLRRSRVGQRQVVPYLTRPDGERLRDFYTPHLEFVRNRFGLEADSFACASPYPFVEPDRPVAAAKSVRLSGRTVNTLA